MRKVERRVKYVRKGAAFKASTMDTREKRGVVGYIDELRMQWRLAKGQLLMLSPTAEAVVVPPASTTLWRTDAFVQNYDDEKSAGGRGREITWCDWRWTIRYL